MDKKVLEWLTDNEGKSFSSPRKAAFGRDPDDFLIVQVDVKAKTVKVKFHKSQWPALPLHFWMFDRTVQYLRENWDKFVRLGAKLQPPYDPDTVEEIIWKKPYLTEKTSYKASPHVCDIIALAGLAEYGYVVNPKTGRRVQGMRFVGEQPQRMPIISLTPRPINRKEDFLEKHRATILDWTIDNENALIEGRRNYSWNNKGLIQCLNERNKISKNIVLSRIRIGGGVDLKTLDAVMKWGGFNQFPLRDPESVLSITTEAFFQLDEGNASGAVHKLMSIYRVGISRASKIIGLSDQDSYCIYDSRVGAALRSLKHDGKRIVLCPQGRSRGGDVCTNKQWAENYEQLIWTLEVMRDHLNQKGYPFRIADVEMALFMMGK